MKPKRISCLLHSALAVFMSLPAFSAPINKADNTDDLNLASSWTGGIVPGIFDVATWSGLAGANTVALGGNLSWRGISIATTGGAVTISNGNTLTLGTSGIDMSSASQNLTISSNLTLGPGNQVWNVASGRTLTLNTGTFTRSAGATLNLQGTGTVAASMTGLANEGTTGILGPWATVGTGSSTTYATLFDGNIISFASGTSVSGASLTSPGDVNTNYNITTASTTTYGAASRQGNTFRLTAGATTLTFGNDANQRNLITNGIMNAGTGLLTITSGGSNANSGIMIGAKNGRELVVNAANSSISLGRIINNTAGASSVTVQGSGANTVTFTGANTYTGGTTVASGTLAANNAAALGSNTAAVSVSSGAKLSVGAAITLGGTVTGAGEISHDGAANVVLSGNFSGFTGTYTQNITNNNTQITSTAATSKDANYNLAVSNGSSGGILMAVAGGGTFELGSLSGVSGATLRNSAAVTAGAISVLQIGNLNTNTAFAGNIVGGGSGSVALTKVGTGTLTLSGANSYTGKTSILNGNLSVASINSVSGGTATSSLGAPVTVANGTIDMGSTTTTGGLTYTGAAATTDRVINLAGTTGGATITQSGTGLLKFTSDITAPGTAAADNRKTLTLHGSTAGTGEISGSIVDSTLGNSGQLATSVNKTGTGSWTLSGANTYSGLTEVQQGKLVVSGSIGNSAVTVSGANTTLASGITGTIGKSVTVSNGAIFAAGDTNAIGTAMVGAGGTTLNSESIFSWDLDTAAANIAGTGYDNVVTGGLAGDVGGASAIFAVVLKSGQSFSDTFWNSSHSWNNIFSTDGTGENALGMSSVFSSFTYNGSTSTPVSGFFTLTGTGGSTLTWSAVPEPSSSCLAGILISAGLLRRRRCVNRGAA